MTAITAIAQRHGLPTPLLDRLVTLIQDVEAGRRTLSPTTFAALSGAPA
jgi:ketopantoate reductase